LSQSCRVQNNAAARRLIIEQFDPPCSKLPMNYKESCAFSLKKKTSSNSASRYNDGTGYMQPPDGTLDVMNLARAARLP
jgi:hypothetical protein